MRHRHSMSEPWSLRWLVWAASTLLIAATPCGTALGQQAVSTPQDALAGSRVFGQEGCGRCHSVSGFGGSEGPDLARVSRGRTFFELAAAMWNHLPTMATRMRDLGIERPRLSDREAGDLIAFLYWLDYFDGPGDADRGGQLFTERRCVSCHQVGGVGGVIGPPLDRLDHGLVPIELATSMWNHAPAMSAAMEASGIRRPRLTAEELNDVIAYLEHELRTGPPEPQHVIPGSSSQGRGLFAEKTCVQCHPTDGSTGALAPDLATGGGPGTLLGFAAAMWNKAPRMMAAMEVRGLSAPQLTAGEMASIVGYLYTVRYFAEAGNAQRGRSTLVSQGCLGCHALDGVGGGSASDLGQIEGFETLAEVTAALWNHILLSPDEVGGRVWPRLQAGQIADVAAYILQR